MSLYQKGAFLIKGLREFTINGYLSAAKSFNSQDLEKDITGNVYMITGANSGLGKSAAIALARKGGEIHMVCRNEERGNAAKNEIVEESSNSNVHLHILDMSHPKDVYAFANKFLQDHNILNVLVNNSGCMVNERVITSDELETNFATNTLGTYILTQQLLPLLKQSDKPRVITVSSGGMYTQKLNVQDMQMLQLQKFEGEMVYAQNKRQQVILTEEWAKQESAVHFSCMHPGWADTPAVRTSMPGFYDAMKNKLRTSEQGADTIVWLAMADAALAKPSGKFFLDRKPTNTHLALAWTRESARDRAQFLQNLAELAEKFKPA
uniref:Dehydrogenase/reductase SDR family member 12-like n=1 Tax=Phallusia mammillata TaxID=59560 RepID=A0A6F9DBN8_9ASCI|nr:dehydrogenase/reductase SDR family member 12-like [Phallusia mammillata]